MPNLEVKHADADISLMCISWTPDNVAFITQTDTGGIKQTILLGPEEARQTVAALNAYLSNKHIHDSDCALHNSPAEEIGPCDCSC